MGSETAAAAIRCRRSYRFSVASLTAMVVPLVVIAATAAGAARAQVVPDAAAATPPPPVPVQTATPPAPPTKPVSPDPGSVAPAAQASRTTPMTLADAIEIALENQPQLTVAGANRRAAGERVRQANARFFPTLTPQYTLADQYSQTATGFVNFVNGIPITQTTQKRTTRIAEMGFNVRLLDSGNRALAARQARQSLYAQEYGEAQTRQTVIGGVADAYFSTLRNTALVKVSQAQIARAQNTLDVVTAQVEAGTSPRKDIYQARADLLNAQVNLLRAQNDAAVAQAQLKNAMGVVGGEALTLADVPPPTPDAAPTATLDVDGVRDEAPAPGTDPSQVINRYADVAYRLRPDVSQAEKNLEANRTAVSLARVNTGPNLAVDLNQQTRVDPIDFDRRTATNRLFNVGVSYPLFDGGLLRSQLRASQATAQATEGQVQNLKQQVTLEVEQAYRNLSQARASLPAARSAQEAAEINFEAALESRREGVGSVVDVITAQTTLVQAQTNFVQATYDFYLADARLARAVGQADRIAGRAAAVAPTAPPSPAVPTPGTAPASQPQVSAPVSAAAVAPPVGAR